MSYRVLTCYYKPKPGGFCTRYFQAINALLDAGCDVHYLAVVPFPIDHPNCYFHRFPWPTTDPKSILFWAVFHSIAPLLLIYIGLKWRVTHSFAFGSNYAFFLQPIKYIKSIPLVLFLRGDSFAHHKTNNQPNWLLWLELLLEGFAIHGVKVLCVSDFLRDRVIVRHKWCKPSFIETLRNDIVLRPTPNKRINGQTLRLACVGVLEPHKNQTLLIRALTNIRSSQIELNIFGVGPDYEQIVSLAKRLRVESKINMKGWVNSDLLWNEIDLLLMPSAFEGCPNAVLEALGRNIPVLASDIPAHREILPVRNLVPVDSPDNWSSRLNGICKNRDQEISLLLASQSKTIHKMLYDWNKRISQHILNV